MKYLSISVIDNAEWSSVEIERFQQAVVEYDKDFVKISQHVSIDVIVRLLK